MAGCAPKEVPVPEPAPVSPPKPSVSSILMQQYRAWKGVPYRLGGTSKKGIDCSGFMQVVFRDGFGIELPRTSVEQSQMGKPVSRLEIRTGDLLFFSTRKTDHIGVAMDAQRFLQASTSHGVIITELERYWWPKLMRVSRILDEERYVAMLPGFECIRTHRLEQMYRVEAFSSMHP
ncbi:hypothetical protein MASR1M90_01140 [Desulfovibrionales bacterium]